MTKIILISGPPGVGKSSLAKRLVRELANTFLLDKDLIDEAFSPGDRGERYTKEVEPLVIEALFNLAEANLNLGKAVLLDLPWTHILIQSPHWKDRILKLASSSGVILKVVELYLSEKELYQRISHRGLDRDQEKLSDSGWQEFINRDHVAKRIPLEHLALDSSQSLEVNFEKAFRYINEAPSL